VKFRVDRDAFGDAVAFVSRALSARPVVPLLSGVLLRVAEDELTLSCFDYEVSARARIEAEVLEPGEALVPGRLLAEITRSLPARPVEFSDEADVLSLTCGRAEFGLVCLPAQDYPTLPESPPPVGTIDGGALAAAVAQVASSASRDDTLPMLTAICLDIRGDVLALAATDRYRMAAREVGFSPARPGLRALALVPARIMVEAARTLTAGVPVTLAFSSDGLISLESGTRRLTARLVAGEFIKYRTRFGDDYGCHADLPAGPVIEAVRRASLVAERVGPVRLSFQQDQVVIEAHAEGRARAAETVPASFTGDQPVISFNPHYLLDGLMAAASAGVSLEVASEAEPAPGGRSRGGRDGHGLEGSRRGGQGSGEGDQGDWDEQDGRIRLSFNTPAKPALITWVNAEGSEPVTAGGDAERVPAFRYLLVPLRVPDRP
jgi:DNA polymerase III subunit beta